MTELPELSSSAVATAAAAAQALVLGPGSNDGTSRQSRRHRPPRRPAGQSVPDAVAAQPVVRPWPGQSSDDGGAHLHGSLSASSLEHEHAPGRPAPTAKTRLPKVFTPRMNGAALQLSVEELQQHPLGAPFGWRRQLRQQQKRCQDKKQRKDKGIPACALDIEANSPVQESYSPLPTSTCPEAAAAIEKERRRWRDRSAAWVEDSTTDYVGLASRICRDGVQAALNEKAEYLAALTETRRKWDLHSRFCARERATRWTMQRKLQPSQIDCNDQRDSSAASSATPGCQENGGLYSFSVGSTTNGRRPSAISFDSKEPMSPDGRYALLVAETGASDFQQSSEDENSKSKAVRKLKTSVKFKKQLARARMKRWDKFRRKQYLELPEEDRQVYESVFKTYDADGSGKLDLGEVRHALLDLGLRPVDAQERTYLTPILEEQVRRSGFGYVEFALGVVLPVRRALRKLRTETFLRYMESHCQRCWDGKHQIEQIVEAGRVIMPLSFLLPEINDKAHKEIVDEYHRLCKSYIEGARENPMSLDELAGKIIDLGERKIRSLSVIQRLVQAKHNLDETYFRKCRHELYAMSLVFNSVDEDGSGHLDEGELHALFKELDVVPRSSMEIKRVFALMQDGKCDFTTFLDMVEEIRGVFMEMEDPHLEASFRQASIDKQSMLSTRSMTLGARLAAAAEKAEREQVIEVQYTLGIQDLRGLLEDFNVLPSNSKDTCSVPYNESPAYSGSATSFFNKASESMEAHPRATDILSWVLQDVDVEGTGRYTYPQMRRIAQMIKERRRRYEVLKEVRVASDCGFKGQELKELKAAYRQLLPPGENQGLDKTRVLKVMGLMHFDCSRPVIFDAAWRTLDQDNSGHLDLCEFLLLVRLMQGKETAIEQELEFLSDLTPLDLRLLIENLGVPPGVADTMQDDQILEKAYLVLGVDPRSPLQKTLNVSNVWDLQRYARLFALGQARAENSASSDSGSDSPKAA
eukprot:TRINITY_DN41578_c0_g1_i1.p1 TRINITY_DN41578_c0_g1~~TRINITY_DN41578_c0_g1_i1.p1  ORF type:complete len:980 (+),score=206.86 TRINITY_DN41578_c0_g1_i1:219-3158(+)